ncbi:MAG: ThiF family adenylyltransferase [Acidimicrobiia bacterium]
MPTGPSIKPTAVDLSEFESILDVRPPLANRTGMPGMVVTPLDELIADPTRFIDDPAKPVLIVCDIGMRSAYVAQHLTDQGYSSVASLEGGLDEWRHQGLPLVGTAGLTDDQLERFDRQIKLPGIGPDGQSLLLGSTVVVVGVGGLGVPVATYLAAAGVGTLILIDPDVVEISNLQRQPIYTTKDAGTPKVAAARDFIGSLTSETRVGVDQTPLDAANAEALLTGADVVVDATDSFAARYAISDAAHKLGVPVVSGAVYRWEGQITTLDPQGPCYRCLFPDAPTGTGHLDCALIGAIGPVVATIGTMQATEVIRLLTGGSSSYSGRLGLYDGAAGTLAVLPVSRRSGCPTCDGAVSA